jgi:predicted Zn-dependent peptidase
MKDHYNIQNTLISAAGNVDNRILELIEAHFGEFANQGVSSDYTIPPFMGEAIFQNKQTEQNHICLSLPGCSVWDERIYGMILLNNTIGGGMSSRLFQEIREKRGLAYSVYSYHSSYMDSGLFTIYTGTAPKQTEEVLKVSLDIIGEMIAKGMTQSELRKGKEQLKGSLILSLESTSSRMNRMGKNELMLGKHFTLDETLARIEAVEMEQIDSLIKQLFANPFALAMVGQSDAAIKEFRRDQLVL